MSTAAKESYQHILEPALKLVKEVGEFIRKEGKDFDRSNIEHKGFNDLVSYVDKEAEKKLVNGLKEIIPDSGFIAEEGTGSASNEAYKWIIDPLDGTTNFLHGLPCFAISVALLHHDALALGIVYEINQDELFYATRGGGAFCNGKTIRVSPVPKAKESLLATGFPYYDFDRMPAYLEILKEFMQQTHGIRRMGSAAVDLVYTAIGRFEGFYEYNLNAWDVAGGAIIVQEAGGTVTDFSGGDDFLFGRQMLASNGATHEELLRVIQQYW